MKNFKEYSSYYRKQQLRTKIMKFFFKLSITTFIISLFLTPYSAFTAPAKLNRQAEKTFSNALKLEKDKQYSQAIEEYEKILIKYPNSAKVLERLSYLYMRSGNTEKALSSAEKAIASGGSCPISLNIKGMILENNGEYGKAEIYYQRAIKALSTYASPYNNLGNLYLKQADLNKAEVYCKKAIELDSDNPLFYNNLGYIQELKGSISSAESSYLKALEKDKNFKQAAENIERMRQNQKPAPPTDQEKKIANEINNIKLPEKFRFLGAFKSEDGSITSVYDHDKKQKIIVKQLPKNNPFTETIFSQTVFDHKKELSQIIKDSLQADKIDITGQGYVMTDKNPVLYIHVVFLKQNRVFEGIFCIVSKANKHLMVTSIANKGFYSKGVSHLFIKKLK